jgi:hypothetical protein
MENIRTASVLKQTLYRWLGTLRHFGPKVPECFFYTMKTVFPRSALALHSVGAEKNFRVTLGGLYPPEVITPIWGGLADFYSLYKFWRGLAGWIQSN